jgi:GTP-binding protein
MAEFDVHARFLKGSSKPEHFPASDMAEVAMIGRSNVGKSSLINAIVRNGSMAKVSSTPGKTREINFFVTDLGVMLVDLPGYGYASVSKTQRQEFAALNRAYLFERAQCKLVCVLLDARIDPQVSDMALLEELEAAHRRFAIVLTKCDKLSKKDVADRVAQIRELTSQCTSMEDVVITSAKSGDGRAQLIGIMKRIRDQHRTQQS